MTKTTRLIITAAAMAGLYAGSLAVRASAQENAGTTTAKPDTSKASCSGKSGCKGTDASKAKASCKGQNACKGQGCCKSGDNGCKGKNSCKGKGGCDTDAKKDAKPAAPAAKS
ncbi:MAG: hypothetical protein ACHQ4G_02900 [Opitutales bacterium]